MSLQERIAKAIAGTWDINDYAELDPAAWNAANEQARVIIDELGLVEERAKVDPFALALHGLDYAPARRYVTPWEASN